MARSELNVALRRADFSAMVGQIVGVKLDIAICGKHAFAVISPSSALMAGRPAPQSIAPAGSEGWPLVEKGCRQQRYSLANFPARDA